MEPTYAVEDRRAVDGVSVFALRGELDLAAAGRLRALVDGAHSGRALVLDLEAVTFVDSAVLKELLRARVELAASGVRLLLAAVPRPVRRLLDLTRTTELFESAPDAGAAVRRLSA
jgi:anti-sigma B factor antagonist